MTTKVTTVEDLLKFIGNVKGEVFAEEDREPYYTEEGKQAFNKLRTFLNMLVEYTNYSDSFTTALNITYADVEDFMDKLEYVVKRGY